MISMQKIYREYCGPVCRSCMNTMTKGHLYPGNCWYVPYPGTCPKCGVPGKNLVAKLKLSGKARTFLR